jgi:hypothetical protein
MKSYALASVATILLFAAGAGQATASPIVYDNDPSCYFAQRSMCGAWI